MRSKTDYSLPDEADMIQAFEDYLELHFPLENDWSETLLRDLRAEAAEGELSGERVRWTWKRAKTLALTT
jgi:hypothetical protein